jgi:hypothetical protein
VGDGHVDAETIQLHAKLPCLCLRLPALRQRHVMSRIGLENAGGICR